MNPVDNIRTLDLDGETITLDPSRFQFNDMTLSKFMEDVSIWYDYYSSKSAKSEELLVAAENDYEDKYLTKFLEGKETLSDKGADAYARVNLEVKEKMALVEKYKSTTKQLKEYLKAFDKAHNMAQNRGYMIRKELEKLHSDIHYSSDTSISDIINELKEK